MFNNNNIRYAIFVPAHVSKFVIYIYTGTDYNSYCLFGTIGIKKQKTYYNIPNIILLLSVSPGRLIRWKLIVYISWKIIFQEIIESKNIFSNNWTAHGKNINSWKIGTYISIFTKENIEIQNFWNAKNLLLTKTLKTWTFINIRTLKTRNVILLENIN